MAKILDFRKDDSGMNFIDRLAAFLNDVKHDKKESGFFLWFDDEGFAFDYFGDVFRLVGGIEYSKCVISSAIIEELSEDEN